MFGKIGNSEKGYYFEVMFVRCALLVVVANRCSQVQVLSFCVVWLGLVNLWSDFRVQRLQSVRASQRWSETVGAFVVGASWRQS